jgi:hypothetical protein
MKLLGYLLMTIALCTGCIAATTAYVPKLTLADEKLLGQRMADPAGILTDPATGEPVITDATTNRPVALFDPSEGLRRVPGPDDETDAPFVVDTGYADETILNEEDRLATITPELLGALRAGGVRRVHVKGFSFERWDFMTGSGLFAVSIVGLIAGAMLVKTAVRKEIAASVAATDAAPEESPEGAMRSIRVGLERLLDELETEPTPAGRLDLIVEQAGVLQREHAAAVPEGRSQLIGRLGLAGYAGFMDRFSAFERQLNRAWSAAADGALPESEQALADAWELLPDAEEKLGLGNGAGGPDAA